MKKKTYTFIAEITEQIPEIPPDSIISRTVYKDTHQHVMIFGFAQGQELSEHTSSKPAMLYFISGQASLTLGKDSKQAGPGTWAQMSPHLPHSILAKTEVRMLLILLG